MQATSILDAFSTGTICFPFVIVDIKLGLNASPENRTRGCVPDSDTSL